MSTQVAGIDPQTLRTVFGHFPSGVVAISAMVEGIPEVLIASSFTVGVSLDPPLVSVAVQHSSKSMPRLRRAKTLGVTVLATDQIDLCRRLASTTDRDSRLNGIDLATTLEGAVEILGGAAWLDCRIQASHPAGDHDIVLLEVLDTRADRTREPLIWHGSSFRSLA